MKMQGFSIIEFMISIGLGLLLTAGLASMYVTNKQNATIQQSLASIADNARFIHYFISQDLRMAGFPSCNKLENFTPVNLITNPAGNEDFNPNNAIQGHEAVGSTWQPALPAWLTNNVATGSSILAGSDVVIIRKIASSPVHLSADMVANSDTINIYGNVAFAANSLVLVTDCEVGNLFKATSGTSSSSLHHDSSLNTSNLLSKAFTTEARAALVDINAYYLKNTGRSNAQGQAIIALYQQDAYGNETELVEGIENLQIQYGVDTDNNGSVDAYKLANAVDTNNEWSQIVSISVNKLLVTIEAVNGKPQRYSFEGNTITPSDHRLRREWSSYIRLRNRGS